MPGEQQDVGATFAERREPQRHNSEAMIEVFTKAPRPYGRLQVHARRCNHPHVHRLASRAAKTPDRPFFERLQKLHLQRIGHQADLIEKDRPAMRHLQQTGLGLPRVGECAALESEQLRFEQCVRNSRAVHVHERSSCPRPGADARGLTAKQPR